MNMTVLEFPTLPSTSLFLKTHYQDFPSWTFVRTDYQTEGYGQQKRTWESMKEQNLLCSLLLKPTTFIDINDLKKQIVTVLTTFLKQKGIYPSFKEPNDFYVNDAKLCGILIETKTFDEAFMYIIIGIGLNVNQEKFPNLNATSLKLITQKSFSIKELFGELTNLFFQNLTF